MQDAVENAVHFNLSQRCAYRFGWYMDLEVVELQKLLVQWPLTRRNEWPFSLQLDIHN